ncbi:hypothetical protein MMC07_000883 [Pseudocyphellaria aurata]|nr:hypothetical protein [Pseudocyphellaria aurata]
MPPANSPSDTQREASATNASYLDQLAELASPVPDFAATLTTQAEQEADDDNVSFLRTQSGPVASPARATPHVRPNVSAEDSNTQNTESQRRMRRLIETVTGRYTPAQLQQLRDSQEVALQAEPSYQGWAPESYEYDDDVSPALPIMNAFEYSAAFHHEPSRRPLRAGSTSQRESRIPQFSQTSSPERYQLREHEIEDLSEITESTLRTTAMLQSVRRNTQFSSRARSQLQNYMLDRERTSHDGEDRDRPRATRPNSSASSIRTHRQTQLQLMQQLQHYQRQQRQQNQQRNGQQRDIQASQREWAQAHDHGHQIRPTRLPVETHRLRHLETPSAGPTIASRSLDDAIKYLERLRFCESLQDSLSSAKAGGFVHEELFANSDFVLDTTTIEPPPESSWLKIGGVLSGSQHATGGSSLPPYVPYSRSAGPGGSHSALLDRPIQSHPATSTLSSGSTNMEQDPLAPHTVPPTPVNPDGDERWAVKVTIHSIDYGTMTLSGTMEAFNVPDKTSPTQESSITTFLEGEIIDFNTFTLETKSFNANARVDGTYWRKLEPFKKLTDDEIVRALVSKKWLADELSRNWILMRWKEKCFVTPSDAQSSLTISGFYYISLRRSDGHVEGLYYDPLSAPYQHLSLMPEKRTFPAYQFQ